MAAILQITCIHKTDRHNPRERILYVGGIDASGKRWKLSEEDAIAGRWHFYVRADGHSVRVILAFSLFGIKYLKTENDGERPNNLLSLPECP